MDASYVAVFDGHGGALASQHCALHLHRHLSQDPALLQDPAKALARAFVKTEEQVSATHRQGGRERQGEPRDELQGGRE